MDAEQELDAVFAARAIGESDLFHRLVEPARSLSSEWRQLSREQRREQRLTYAERVRAALDEGVAAAPTSELAARVEAYWPRLRRLFGKRPL
jgi:hypothetical protein